jgi:methylenetetrahydrofolate dehydrogenase (NADP+)/methenyltetrahydrofolate cyclohydrolase
LLHRNATITICHSRTRDLPSITRNADILVAAIGKPKYVQADWVKPGATVIDVGINEIPDATKKSGKRLVGDVDFENVKEVAGAITPVPGGVGPMTIAMLMQNTLTAAQRAAGLIK